MALTFFLLLNIIVLQITVLFSKEKQCAERTKSGLFIKICCADYEEINSTCIACEIGFTSYAGQNCTACPEQTYGKRCAKECQCTAFQRCDNIVGCTDEPSTEQNLTDDNYTAKYVKTDYETNRLLYTKTNQTESIEETKSATRPLTYTVTNKTPTNEKTDGITRLPTYTVTNKTPPNEKTELSSRETIAYLAFSVVVFVLLICLGTIFIRHLMVIQNRNQTRNSTGLADSNPNRIQVEQSDSEDHGYETIDDRDLEEPLRRINIRVINNYLEVVHESFDSRSSTSGEPDRNSYLNPYQPIIPIEKASSYEKLQLNDMQLSISRSNISSNSSNNSRNGSTLLPISLNPFRNDSDLSRSSSMENVPLEYISGFM